MQVIIISGLSGAGKSTALKVLEDSGYICIDNVPSSLIKQIIEINSTYKQSKIAISIDSRSYFDISSVSQTIDEIKQTVQLKVIFLESRDDVIIKRFSETRRRHPLSRADNTIIDCINQERELLSEISNLAQRIDTSDLTNATLKQYIRDIADGDTNKLNIIIQSFGFKYGTPTDSDYMFDVRCLPNPYYIAEIKEYNGTQAPIIEYLEKQPLVQEMIEDISGFISRWIPRFIDNHRSYLTIAIGCTGGHHRSVYITEYLRKNLSNSDYNIIVRHRELDKKKTNNR